MELAYYPGCTLYTKATHLDKAGRESLRLLGIDLKELEDWTCCGASFPLVNDYHMGLASPSRVLADTKEQGHDKLVAVCSVCYNVLSRTNYVFKTDGERKDKINDFIERDYNGDTEVIHYLEILRDIIGFEDVKKKISSPLKGLKIAPYYGCLLLRPYSELNLDDPENPVIFEKFIDAVGAESVYFPYKNECCGAFQVMNSTDIADRCSKEIINNAVTNDADIIVTSCPLCQYNLDDRQVTLKQKFSSFTELPVVYFTQLLGLALDVDPVHLEFERNNIDPTPLFREKGYI